MSCEDQGFTKIEDGCHFCPPLEYNPLRRRPFVKQQSPSNANLKGGGPLYWYCNTCKGYFGEVK